MVEQFPMVCDSCAHYLADEHACEAFADEIPLDPIMAELHDEPLPGQGNNIVYEQAPGEDARSARESFDKFRAATLEGEG